MNAAFKMLKLDLLTMQVYLKSYILFMIYPLLFAWWEPVGMAVMGGLMLAMLGGSIFSVQEKNKLERLYGVLSISDGSLVAGRYLFLVVNCLVVQLVMVPLHFVASQLLARSVRTVSDMIFAMGLSYFLFWLQCFWQIPLYFRYGYTKMRIWTYLPLAVIALGTGAITAFLKEKLPDIAPGLEVWLTNLFANGSRVAMGFFVIGTLLAIISYLVSVGCYRSYRR